MTKKKMVHLALRISPELESRVKKCAEELRLKKHALAQAAVEAAVDAIEQNNYSLVLPIKFDVTRVPIERGKLALASGPTSRFPDHREEITRLEENSAPKKKTGT